MIEKRQTTSIIVRKSRGDIEICWSGGVDVMGPTESEGAGGTKRTEEAGEVGSGSVTDEAVDTGIWGSLVCTVGGGADPPYDGHLLADPRLGPRVRGEEYQA